MAIGLASLVLQALSGAIVTVIGVRALIIVLPVVLGAARIATHGLLAESLRARDKHQSALKQARIALTLHRDEHGDHSPAGVPVPGKNFIRQSCREFGVLPLIAMV